MQSYKLNIEQLPRSETKVNKFLVNGGTINSRFADIHTNYTIH